MTTDELGPNEPMTDERFKEINELCFKAPLPTTAFTPKGMSAIGELCVEYQKALAECIDEIDRLKAENAALLKDKDRLDWMDRADGDTLSGVDEQHWRGGRQQGWRDAIDTIRTNYPKAGT